MRNPCRQIRWPLSAAALLAYASLATAQTTQYWDPALTGGSAGGGAGTWSSAANWFDGASDTAWTNGNFAVFGGTAGTVTLGAAETANGVTFNTAGYTLSGSATLTLGGTTPTITVPAGTTTINPVIAGSAGLTISGPGRLVSGAANTYTGGTTVGAGSMLQINNVAGAGASSGTIALGTGGVLAISNRVNNAAIANPIAGDATSVINIILGTGFNTYLSGSLAGFYGTIVCTNTGVSDLAGMNTAPPLTMPATAGGWIVAANAELYISLAGGVEAAPITINGPGYSGGYGAIRLDIGTVAGNILLNGSGNNNQIGGAGATSVTFSGIISDGGNNYGLNIWGGGSTPANKVFVLSGQNTYGGPTTLSVGEVQVAAAENPGISGPLGRSNALSVIYFSAAGSAGALQYSTANQYDYSGRFATSAGQKYKIDVNGRNVSFATPLTSSGGTFLLFDTAGGGTLTLNAANTYSGGTTISNGTLVANAAGAIPTGAVSVNGGRLNANVAGAIPGSVTVNSGMFNAIAAGSVLGNITVAGTGALTISNSSALSQFAILTLPASPANNSVNLNFTGTQTISALYFGSTAQATGTWGPIGSIAVNQTSAFTGTGLLDVEVPTSANFYWDPGALRASPGSGGAGTWSIAANWWLTGNSDTTWIAGNIANFAGSAGTVTLGANETAQGLTFTTPGYIITSSSGSVLTLVGSPTVSVAGGNATIACPIAGTVGLTQTGPGSLVSSGTNTYTGPTTINGTLTVAGAGQLGSGNYVGNITDTGTFIYNSSAAQTLGGVISDAGTLTQQGAGVLTLSGANTYSGGTTVNSNSTLQITSGTSAGTGPVTITNTGVFTVNATSASTVTLANQISGASNSVVNFYQNANYSVAGDLSQFNGTINLVASSNPADEVIVPAGSAAYNLPATATWNIASGQTLAFGGGDTDNATVILHGPGNTVGFGALRLDSLVTQAGNVLLAGTNNWIGSFGGTPTISGIIMDSGSGKGVVLVARANSPKDTIAFSGANTYSGTTTLSNGTLQVASTEIPGTSGPLGSSTISFAGGDGTGNFGTLQYSGANQFDYSSRFSTTAGQKYNIDVNGQTVTFAAPLTSSGGVLTLTDNTGGGTLILSAANTYNGGTFVSAGTLVVSNGSIMGAVTVSAGAALQLDHLSAVSTWGTFSVVSGASVSLNFTGTQDIGALYLDGATQALGTWGAIGSGAAHESAVFSGSGILNVTTATYTTASWDPNSNHASPGSGGSGNWDNATANWWLGGGSDSTWIPGSIANFAGAAGTVTLNGSQTANGLNFLTPGYTLTSSPGAILTLAGIAPTITVPAGLTAIACTLASPGGLAENGPGTLLLGAANTYSGGTTVSSGSTLQIANGAGAGTGPITLNGTGVFTVDATSGSTVTLANQISGASDSVVNFYQNANYSVTGDLSQFNGIINLVANSNPADEVIVPAGSAAYNLPATATWNIASGQTLAFVGSGTDNATVILNGPGNTVGFGALRLDSLVTQAGNVLLAGTNNGIGSFGGTPTISGIIMDSGSGKGVVIVARANSSRDTIVFSGANTYSGTTTLINGTLQVASAEIPGTSGPLGSSTISFAGGDGTSNFGTLQYSSANQFDYSSRFSTAAGQKYNIDVNGQTVTFATPLTSSGGVLTLTDTASGGTLTLTATNTYSGGTTIAAGTLDVSSGSILGGVTVTRGTLQLDNPSSLSLGTILTLVSGATVNLTYSGNQRITDLFVDGAEQAPGVYGTGANNPNGSFIGSGTLTVIGKSPTTVSAVSIDGNHQLAISWASVPGANYNVYSTTNLGQPILWTLVNSSPILATGTTTSYTLPGSIAGQPQLFVRVGQ